MKKPKRGRFLIELRTAKLFGCRLKSPRCICTFVALVVLAGAVSILTLCPSASAGESVYDNTHLPSNPSGADIFLPGPSDDEAFFAVLAQPFQLGDNNTVSSISLRLGRWDGTSGVVSGPWRFSIWDDDGNGRPSQPVGELGAVDVSTLPNFKPIMPNELETVDLDFSVAGLIPTKTYYVVGDNTELDGLTSNLNTTIRDAVLTPFLPQSGGTNGAGELWISRNGSQIEWESLRDFGLGRRWLQLSVMANTTAFHNLHVESDEYVNVLGNDRMHAQQFFMDSRQSVDEVTVTLSRQGSASGSVTFEIWDDNGFDNPMQKIGELGTISDVSQIPTTHTNFTFDDRITGLIPEETYWVVANYSGLNEPLDETNSVGWTVALSSDGANDAANANASVNSGKTWLGDLGQLFGVDPFKFKMSVETGRLDGDFNGDGAFNTSDIDLLTAEIASGTSDTKFDLTGDDTVNVSDLIDWRSEAATHNGFSQAYLEGDSNLDGSVNAMDLNSLALNWQQSVDKWSGGDFTADGVVDAGDLNALALNWQQSIAMASATASVPEPSALALAMSIAGLALFWRRSTRVR